MHAFPEISQFKNMNKTDNTQDLRWGIVYCPKRGFRNSRKLWQKVLHALDERSVKYDFVQSENTGGVRRLISMFINNGYKKIVIVGGDSALSDAVNCLMNVEKSLRDTISLGVIPNGVVNDFARFWDFKENEVQQTVDWLINHRVRKIDLGCVRYENSEGQSKKYYFLNCVNIGLVADLMNQRSQVRKTLGSRTLAFIISFWVMLFHRMDYKMKLKINTELIDRKVMNVCVGSGPGYGQTPNAVPYNGLLDVSVVHHPEIKQLFAGLWLLVSGRFLNHRNVHPYRTREVQVIDANHALVGVDGSLIEKPQGTYRITVEQEVINFLIPT